MAAGENFSLGTTETGETHLDELVPARRDDDGVLGVGAEADAGDPVGVALLGDGVLAVTESVPELDGLVPRAGDDLAVVGGERDGEDVVVVADETAGGRAGGELPKAEGLVPRGGQGVGAVGRDDLGRVSKNFLGRTGQRGARRLVRADVHSRRRCESGP